MRISSIVRVIENQIVAVSGAAARISVAAYNEAEKEVQARALFRAENKGAKAARIEELRAVVEALDAAKVERETQAMRSAARAAKRAATKAAAHTAEIEALNAKNAAIIKRMEARLAAAKAR